MVTHGSIIVQIKPRIINLSREKGQLLCILATLSVKECLSLSNLRWEEDGTLVKIIKQG